MEYWIVKSDYEWQIADFSGPFEWTDEQFEAVETAYSLDTMTHGYALPYENEWHVVDRETLFHGLEKGALRVDSELEYQLREAMGMPVAR